MSPGNTPRYYFPLCVCLSSKRLSASVRTNDMNFHLLLVWSGDRQMLLHLELFWAFDPMSGELSVYRRAMWTEILVWRREKRSVYKSEMAPSSSDPCRLLLSVVSVQLCGGAAVVCCSCERSLFRRTLPSVRGLWIWTTALCSDRSYWTLVPTALCPRRYVHTQTQTQLFRAVRYINMPSLSISAFQ